MKGFAFLDFISSGDGRNDNPPCLTDVDKTPLLGVTTLRKEQAVQAKQARNFGPAEKSGEAGRPDERPGPAPLMGSRPW
jgi:hypothetical protein